VLDKSNITPVAIKFIPMKLLTKGADERE